MNETTRRRSGFRPIQSSRHPQKNALDARQNCEHYLARAVEAQRSGDVIETENCYQHAEHYFRTLRDAEQARRDRSDKRQNQLSTLTGS